MHQSVSPSVALHHSLIAFMEEKESRGYLQNCTSAAGKVVDPRVTYSFARRRLRPQESYPRAGHPNIESLEAAFPEYWQQIQAHPDFPGATTGARDIHFGLVELKPLVSLQIHIDDVRATRVCSGIDASSSTTELLQRCLPLSTQSVNYRVISQEANRLMLTTRDPNIVAISITSPSTGPGTPPEFEFVLRPAFTVVARVAKAHGVRCVLRNGYHRALQIGKEGHSAMPCILADYTNYESVGIGKGHFPTRVVMSQSPPTVGHFLDDRAFQVYQPSPELTWTVTW